MIKNIEDLIGKQPVYPVDVEIAQDVIFSNLKSLWKTREGADILWLLLKAFTYGVIWGKRSERAKRNGININLSILPCEKP